ncbi:hypothetical protein L596_002702 [Steinernema carpocapsae]|uniref:Uncharacterized protein n=1 Tax=Steinernema carpocapsae TaxID=34508 RepID=A0A4V6I7S8_STECR|nr:hypothetical protein L596_002702 [Steinernema carpocapsae]
MECFLIGGPCVSCNFKKAKFAAPLDSAAFRPRSRNFAARSAPTSCSNDEWTLQSRGNTILWKRTSEVWTRWNKRLSVKRRK